MKAGTVTVVIPLYKGERWIEETLSSVVSQTWLELEILVIDDGSPDNSVQIVEQFCRRDSRIRLIRKENGGVCSARNHGLLEAKGEYFAPLDQDDLWHPDKLRLQVQRFQDAGPEAAVVYCWCSAIDSRGCILRRDAGVSHAEGDVLADLIMANWMPSGSVPLFRTSAIRNAGGYRGALNPADDIDLYLRLAEQATFLVVREFLVGYRQHETNVSNDGTRMVQQYERVMQDVRKRLPRTPAKLLRWSTANLRFHYGIMALRGRQFIVAARLLITAFLRDPALLERVPPIFLKKISDRARAREMKDDDVLKGRRFLDLSPHEGARKLQHPDRWARRKAELNRGALRYLRLRPDGVAVGTAR
ncbi:MAG TPA: glycosyltransferase [Acidobacteriaceae bacterium]|jgi:glycosyltransferase involved in cell wall biosynthesis|nr:glycosyltransferase [Acidobacteriaceae bacterium]